MKRFLLVLVAALALPAAAAAKGPDQASISGPGLKTITLAGSGEEMGTALGEVTELAGFFPAAFRRSPDPMTNTPPTRSLGPKYRIHYRVPGPEGQTFWVDQDLYPYAKGGSVTYMRPGQPILGGAHTRGGWFLAGTQLELTLQRHGLPASPPAAASGTSTGLVAGIAVPGALALAAAGLLYRKRGRQA